MAAHCRWSTILFWLILLLANLGMTQRASEEEEQLEMERHGANDGDIEGEEGSGNSFNPDDEDDFSEASGLPPSAEDGGSQHHQYMQHPITTMATTLSTTTTRKQEKERPLAPKIHQRPAVSPTPPTNEAEDIDNDAKHQFQSALLLSTIAALALLAALGVLACCCCCCRQSRRRRRQQDGYTQGREHSKHYL